MVLFLITFAIFANSLSISIQRVSDTKTILIGDFGLAEDLYSRDQKQCEVRLPVKWMPPESLRDGVSNERTDMVGYYYRVFARLLILRANSLPIWHVLVYMHARLSTLPIYHNASTYPLKIVPHLRHIICPCIYSLCSCTLIHWMWQIEDCFAFHSPLTMHVLIFPPSILPFSLTPLCFS